MNSSKRYAEEFKIEAIKQVEPLRVCRSGSCKRALVMQKMGKKPVQFEMTKQTRDSLSE